MSALDSATALASLVRGNPDPCRWTGELTPQEIARAEAELALTFPPSYQLYPTELGACEVGGVEFPSIRQTVRETLEARADLNFPPHLLIIELDGMGGLLSPDTSASAAHDAEHHEAPVVVWGGCGHCGDAPESLAPNSGSYAMKTATRELGGAGRHRAGDNT